MSCARLQRYKCVPYIYSIFQTHNSLTHMWCSAHMCVCVCLHILESKYRNMQLCNLHAECAFLVVSQRTVSRQNCTAATTCLGRLITALLRLTQFVFKCRFNGAGFSSNFFQSGTFVLIPLNSFPQIENIKYYKYL